MIINVEGTDIETKEIVSIKDAGWRMHGFIIKLTEAREVKVCKPQEYDMTPQDCGWINDRYRKLEDKVHALWQSDKREIPTLTI
tara:strand:+ start:102 stop:353 length:252 start_codon:yes stop_codon:yes gene_type:complete